MIAWIKGVATFVVIIIAIVVGVRYVVANPGIGHEIGTDIHGLITAVFGVFSGATGQ
jgi:hypothetical protein